MYRCNQTDLGYLGQPNCSHRDDNFPPSMSFPKVAEGIGSLVERVTPVDNWFYLAGFDQLAQKNQIILAGFRRYTPELLAPRF